MSGSSWLSVQSGVERWPRWRKGSVTVTVTEPRPRQWYMSTRVGSGTFVRKDVSSFDWGWGRTWHLGLDNILPFHHFLTYSFTNQSLQLFLCVKSSSSLRSNDFVHAHTHTPLTLPFPGSLRLNVDNLVIWNQLHSLFMDFPQRVLIYFNQQPPFLCVCAALFNRIKIVFLKMRKDAVLRNNFIYFIFFFPF